MSLNVAPKITGPHATIFTWPSIKSGNGVLYSAPNFLQASPNFLICSILYINQSEPHIRNECKNPKFPKSPPLPENKIT